MVNLSRLDHQIEAISCPEFLQHWKAGGQWAVASPDEIAKKLVLMKDNYNSFQKNALTASQTIRDHFSWRNAAEQAVDSLQSQGLFSMAKYFW